MKKLKEGESVSKVKSWSVIVCCTILTYVQNYVNVMLCNVQRQFIQRILAKASNAHIAHTHTHTHTHNRLTSFVRDKPGRPVPEETLTYSHPTWSSDILYHLPPFTTIHGILFVHSTCLTILSDNLSPGPLWSSSSSWTLNFILHTYIVSIQYS